MTDGKLSILGRAVKWAYEHSRPYFRENEIPQRIAAKNARTFEEFYQAIGLYNN